MPLEQLMQQKGVGEVRAIGIAAALELGRRCFEEMSMVDKRAVTSPELVYRVMIPVMKHLDHEESWALYLNRNNYLIGKEMITVGRMETTLIDTRRIVRKAIEKQCSQVVLVHNHPSGQALPSQADIRQTDILRKALAAVEIGLMDHIIVCEDSFFSFSEEKLVKM
jgi:DNA repair protein RadC